MGVFRSIPNPEQRRWQSSGQFCALWGHQAAEDEGWTSPWVDPLSHPCVGQGWPHPGAAPQYCLIPVIYEGIWGLMPHSLGSGAEGFLSFAPGLCSRLGNVLAAELLSGWHKRLGRWDAHLWAPGWNQKPGSPLPALFASSPLFPEFWQCPRCSMSAQISVRELMESHPFIWVLLSCRNNSSPISKERILFPPKTSLEWKFLPLGSIRTDQGCLLEVFVTFSGSLQASKRLPTKWIQHKAQNSLYRDDYQRRKHFWFCF